MSKRNQEIGFWLVVSLMICLALLHGSQPAAALWRSLHASQRRGDDHRRPQQPRTLAYALLLIFPGTFYAGFTYLAPASLLFGGKQYCDGGRFSRTNCRPAPEAGSRPVGGVAFPTFFMWFLDLLVCHFTGALRPASRRHSGPLDPEGIGDEETTCSSWWTRAGRVMPPRYGATCLYAGLICYAGSLQASSAVMMSRDDPEREEEEAAHDHDDDRFLSDDDDLVLLRYSDRLARAGHVFLALGGALLAISLSRFFPSLSCSAEEAG